jgi:3'-phosphoadenosine 5'-phosphosulfate sulfotransferase (PAPS reductase)/FAD synthetase
MSNPLRAVSVSGGKDSEATILLALDDQAARGGDVELLFCDTGNEHELTLEHNRYLERALGIPITTLRVNFDARIAAKRTYVAEHWAAKGVPQAQIDNALAVLQPTGNPFLDLCTWKGRFPSRMAQFCTQELKRRPLDDYMLRQLEGGKELESWRGIRRDESDARRNAKATERAAEGWLIVHPIVDWTAQQTVDFVRSRGLELNPLYSQGMRRVGCMPCINCGKDELLEIATRFPEHVARIREWERLVGLASKRAAASFFTEKAKISKTALPGWTHVEADPVEQEEEHWVEPMADVLERCSIDERIQWAKTSRGGKQFDMLRVEVPSPSCSSLYGLCE